MSVKFGVWFGVLGRLGGGGGVYHWFQAEK